MNPMLSKPINQDQLVALINDEAWAFSPKLDGKRFLATIDKQGVRAYGRNGQSIDMPHAVRDALHYKSFTASGAMCTVDGELMKSGSLVLFDLLDLNMGTTAVTIKDPYHYRYQTLQTLYAHLWAYKTCPVRLLTHAVAQEDKVKMTYEVLTQHGEGIVARLMSAPYHPGVRSTDSVKFKVVKTVDCEVTGKDFEGRDNLVLSVYFHDKPVEIGRVSALTGQGKLAQVGDVVEVKYLSFNGRLVQPTYPIIRKDKKPSECTMDQLVMVDLHSIESQWLERTS